MPKNTPRTRARWIAAWTLALTRSAKRARSAGSCTKLWTVRIWENASSATPVASASRSWTPVVMLRSRRPKKIADPTTSGATASAVSVSRGWSHVSSTTPPTSERIWRANSETW